MRTRFEVVIAACDAPRADWDAVAEEALEAAEDWHARLTRFEPGSPVWLINERAGTGDATPIDSAMVEFLSACARLRHDTAGAFDPTRSGAMDALEIDEHTMTARLTRAGVSLDFGAAGKGQALDDAGEILRSLGVTSGLVHGGTSSVLAIGNPPDDTRGWGVLACGRTLFLRDAAMGSSSPAAGDSTRGAHIVDPGTGEHVPTDGHEAAVITERALDADAWATALTVDPTLPTPNGVRSISGSV